MLEFNRIHVEYRYPEFIIRQMFLWKIEDPGDSGLHVNSIVSKQRFRNIVSMLDEISQRLPSFFCVVLGISAIANNPEIKV